MQGNFVRDVLDRGVRLGFIGSGDGHDGNPGLSHLSPVYGWVPPRPGEDFDRVGTGGLAGMLSEELTSEGILEALRARRTYATNGPRILIRATLAGEPIGSLVRTADMEDESRLELTVVGTGPLASVDLVRSGTIERLELPGDSTTFDGALVVRRPAPGEYLYLRLEQRDGGMAWTSPFFFE